MTTDTIIIETGKIDKQYWKDVWKCRELLYFLSKRDVSVRYKQTLIGLLWSVVRPLITMTIFTFVFGRIAKLPSEGNIPYPIMVLSGLIAWQFFAAAINAISNSVIDSNTLISKIYFPRIIMPIAATATSLIEFFISFLILLLLMIYYHYMPDYHVFCVPLFLLLVYLTALGLGMLIAVFNVKYRDFVHIIPFALQVGMYLSPVGFAASIIPKRLEFIYSLNPLVGIINGFRWAVSRGDIKIYVPGLIASIIVAAFFLFLGLLSFRKGLLSFRKAENGFADNI